MDWGDQRNIDLLTQMWTDNVPTAQIGDRMGISKNALVGKAHRLGLEPRPSPIKPLAPGEVRKVKGRAVAVADVPKLESISAIADAEPVITAPTFVEPEREETPPQAVKPRAPFVRSVLPCCYPVNSAKPWRYCDADSLPGRAMCAEHHALCHLKPKALKPSASPAQLLDPSRRSPLTSRNW